LVDDSTKNAFHSNPANAVFDAKHLAQGAANPIIQIIQKLYGAAGRAPGGFPDAAGEGRLSVEEVD